MRSTDAALRAVGLQASLDGVEESEGGSAVEDAVVEGDFEVHHAADGDGVVEDDGAFDYGFGGEDGRLRVRPVMFSSSASGMTGTTRASSRSTATPMFTRFLRMMRSPSHTEFNTGFSLRLSTTAFTMNGR